MKLFVDDLRPYPEGYECCRTYDDAVLLLSILTNIETVNLDFDLGTPKTGLDILIYMKENDIHPKEIIVHSSHPEGVKMMEKYIKEHFRDCIYYRT